MIDFRTLGGIDLQTPAGARIESILSQPKRLALFAYLVLERPGSLHRRDTLVGVFWPEMDDERARAALRKSLHHLRSSLGDEVLAGQGEEAVGVRAGSVRCDVLELERALQAGDLAAGLELYGGDLLNGLFVSEAPDFEHWLDRRRWELRERASQAAWTLAERELSTGNPAGAAHWGRRAYAFEPLGEPALRRLVALLDRVGDRVGALLTYAEFARRMEAEGLRPSPETSALIAELRARADRVVTAAEASRASNEPGADVSAPPLGVGEAALPANASPPAGSRESAREGPGVPKRRAFRVPVGLAALGVGGLLLAGVLAVRTTGTLLEEGVLEGTTHVVLGDFASPDEGLGRAVTEAVRIDLAQSRVVRPVAPERVAEGLIRMRLGPSAPLDTRAALELARREGYPAVITGTINPAGKGFLLSAALLSASDGGVLASARATARDSASVLDAIDELSRVLRRRIGESANALRDEPSLEQVTTSNLHALESFSLALRAFSMEADISRGIALLEDAVELDSTFAAAHATLGLFLDPRAQRTRAVGSLTTAYSLRQRLPDRERLWITAHYHRSVERDLERAAHAYETLIELEADRAPTSDAHDLHAEYAEVLLSRRQDALAEQHARRAVALDSTGRWMGQLALGRALAYQGEFDAAKASIDRYLQRVPDHPRASSFLKQLEAASGVHDGSVEVFERLGALADSDSSRQSSSTTRAAELAAVRGLVGRAQALLEVAISERIGPTYGALVLSSAVRAAHLDVDVARRPDRALARVDGALKQYPLSDIPVLDRPYLQLAELFASAGASGRARSLLDEVEMLRAQPSAQGSGIQGAAFGSSNRVRGAVALAEGRPAEAVIAYRSSDTGRCRICALPGLALAYDRAGQADSAIAVYERYLSTPEIDRLGSDALHLARTYERLGQMYQAKGDVGRAASYHEKFVTLWRHADSALQPRVEDARRRLKELGSGVP